MAVRFRTIDPIVNEPFSDFAARISATFIGLGEIQLLDFDISRVRSSRAGSGFRATLMYDDVGGTFYTVYNAVGEPEAAQEALNAQFVDNIYSRARFLRTLFTGDTRRLAIGLVAVCAALPYESQIGRQATILAQLPDELIIVPGATGGLSPQDRNYDLYGAIEAENRGTINAQAGRLAQVVWRDPSSSMWYFYPACY